MKAIVPTAGNGTRLYPHTHTKPKPMVRLAGKPILGHILTNFRATKVDEIVVVVGGPMQNQVIEYAQENYSDRFELTFVEQESPQGLGHSIYQAESAVRGDSAVIALGDMLFQNGYRTFLEAHDALSNVDGSIGLKRVTEPHRYGIASVENGRITELVEKPVDPPSDLAISGVYVIEDTGHLFDSLEHLLEKNRRGAGGEYQLTDALNLMVSQGSVLGMFKVDDWYDCGRPKTLLEANRITLEQMGTGASETSEGNVIIEPVDVGTNVTINESVIGPYVSIDDGATIINSIVRDCIVGRNTTLRDATLTESLLGDNSTVEGEPNSLNIGDNSSISISQ
ncbi:sugar phosphate nucleotidyltransferase [Natronococcus occultus]|nr:sugar phosphate nucleotidyltransferase [Natronococcus occultus]